MKNEFKHTQLNETKWSKWANSYDDKGWINDSLRNAQKALISVLDIKENMCFLDIGCGTGWVLGQIDILLNGKGQFYGVDLAPKMIDKAKENFKDKGNFHFIKANAEAIPLDNNLFDIIICTNSFHHYLHPDKALKEMFRLLKVEGKLYLLDPTADWWFVKLVDKLIKLFEPEHVKLYSTKEFKELFTNSGLRYVETKVKMHEKIHIGEKQEKL